MGKSTASSQALRRRRPQQSYWVETAAACCSYYGGESAPPANEHTLKDRDYCECRYEEKILAALRRVRPDGYGDRGAFSLLKLKPQGVGVQRVGSFRFFSAQPDSTIEISLCTP